MYTIKHQNGIKLKCPRHIRFDPTRHSWGDVKAGCPFCTQLLSVFAKKIELNTALMDFWKMCEKHEELKGK